MYKKLAYPDILYKGMRVLVRTGAKVDGKPKFHVGTIAKPYGDAGQVVYDYDQRTYHTVSTDAMILVTEGPLMDPQTGPYLHDAAA